MGRRRKKYKPHSFESTGRKNDTSANLYDSMLSSPAFLDMSKPQRLLYVYMKNQFYGKRKPYRDYPDVEEWQGDDELFYFNHFLAVKYGLYSAGNKKGFYDDVRSIADHGFIEVVSSGQATKSKSIYRYSSKWKKWSDTS